jgi:DNA-binding NarL/FixJ family response regulator
LIYIAVVAPVLALRAGLRLLLSADDLAQVIFESDSLENFDPKLDSCDILLITQDGVVFPQLRRVLLRAEGRLAVLLLTNDPQQFQGMLSLPIRSWGILPVDTSGEELVAAVRAVHEGLLVGTPVLLKPAISRVLRAEEETQNMQAEQLTERELQVLQLLARGFANKQIAVDLGISEHTVKFHVSSILAKLGVSNRTEAVQFGLRRGLVLL